MKERIIDITRRRVGDIMPNERNPKRPSSEKRERLTAVLQQYGKAGVLLTYTGDDGQERFFDGNTRRNLDPDDVWYIARTDLTQAEVDGLVLFYDPLAEPDWEAELVKMLAAETAVDSPALVGMLDEILAELAAGLYGTLPPANAANDPNEEWEGMPEFEQNDVFGSAHSIKIHFADIKYFYDFCELIGQKISEAKKSAWYPNPPEIIKEGAVL
jgi:hypothetical protein